MSKFLIEKIASGLRAMNTKPDAFLYTGGGDNALATNEICGIPIFFSALVDNQLSLGYCNDIPFIPMWREDGDYIRERTRFNDAYDDFAGES